jgi:hypothetical protein
MNDFKSIGSYKILLIKNNKLNLNTRQTDRSSTKKRDIKH